MTHNPPIVVGVDGSKDSWAAIRYAAFEAERLGASVRLVHVVPTYLPLAPMLPLLPADLRDTGRDILRRAEAEARTLLPAERVSSALLDGPRIAALVQAADESLMIALGHERRSTVDRLLTGATVTAVAAGALSPVIAVPTEWTPETEHHCVLVGMKSTEHSAALLRRGFLTAAQHGARLLIVHAWELPMQYDDLLDSLVDSAAWEGRARHAIELSAAAAAEDYPEVRVDVRVVRGQPARVLLEAAQEADVVMLARRAHAFPGRHLGGTARALLRECDRPVVITPPADGETTTTETAGHRAAVDA